MRHLSSAQTIMLYKIKHLITAWQTNFPLNTMKTSTIKAKTEKEVRYRWIIRPTDQKHIGRLNRISEILIIFRKVYQRIKNLFEMLILTNNNPEIIKVLSMINQNWCFMTMGNLTRSLKKATIVLFLWTEIGTKDLAILTVRVQN